MKTTKIEWVDCTINPVMGCPRGCPYCYAKRMNDRYKWIEDFSKPQFFPERLNQLESKKPKSIFMNSMSDHNHWTGEQRGIVHRAMIANPQHTYLFLTKVGACVGGIGATYDGSIKAYHGFTLTKNDYIPNCAFLSIEPLLEQLKPNVIEQLEKVRHAVIIGAETGNRRGKIIPHKEWVDSIVAECDRLGLVVFMKNSLQELVGADFRQDRLPWEVSK